MSGRGCAALLAVAFLFSACAANDQANTRAQGVGAGAALGAGIGALIGNDPEDILIGATVGGLVGLAAGDAVARKKANYASAEDMIARERRIATEEADTLAAYNVGLERDLESLNDSIEEMEADVVRGRSEHVLKVELRRRAEEELGEARQRLAEVSQEIDVSRRLYEEARADVEAVDLAEWDRRIRELERRRSRLVQLIGDFETSRQRIV
jgi:hypothetical protein